MSVEKATLYIKTDQNVEVHTKEVTLGDLVSMECVNHHVTSRLKTTKILHVAKEGTHRFVISILKIIEKIHEIYPNLNVEHMGAPDVIVTYEPLQRKSRMLYWMKCGCIFLIAFIGAGFSIMAFNNDVDVPRLFSQIYEQVIGKPKTGFSVLEATYCLGVFVGILVFFNHFGKKRFSVDPTPIEVEMRLYENDIQTTIIQNYAREEKEIDVDKRSLTGVDRA